MPLTDKEKRTIVDELKAVTFADINIDGIIQRALAKAAGPELPPKPEKLPDGFAYTGECRLPKNDEWFMGHCGNAEYKPERAIAPDPVSRLHCGGNRWILTKRPSEPPTGYTWSARGYDVPKRLEWYLDEIPPVKAIQAWAVQREKRWLLDPLPAPKSAYQQGMEEHHAFLKTESMYPTPCPKCFKGGWKAACAAILAVANRDLLVHRADIEAVKAQAD